MFNTVLIVLLVISVILLILFADSECDETSISFRQAEEINKRKIKKERKKKEKQAKVKKENNEIV